MLLWISYLWIVYLHHSQLPSLHSGGHDEVFFHQGQWPWPIVSLTRQPFTLTFSSHQLGLANYVNCRNTRELFKPQLSHSGAAIIGPCNGIPDHLIQALGHWSSCAYQLYIQTLSNLLTSLSFKLS